MLPKLGIIAGNGDLPNEIANLYKSVGGDYFIAALHEDALHEGGIRKKFAIGEVGGIVKFFQENSVENIIIIGGIDRPDIASLKVDFAGSALVARILKQKILGDDNILKIISQYLESKEFKVISPKDVLKLNESSKIISTKAKPLKQDLIDIEIGISVIESLGKLDVGQSVIVSDGYVIGIEAAEGTDNLIKRCASLRKKKHRRRSC